MGKPVMDLEWSRRVSGRSGQPAEIDVAGAVWLVNPIAPVVALVGTAAVVGAEPADGTPALVHIEKSCPAPPFASVALSIRKREVLLPIALISWSRVVIRHSGLFTKR